MVALKNSSLQKEVNCKVTIEKMLEIIVQQQMQKNICAYDLETLDHFYAALDQI
jgi:hypothetical protein